MKVLKGVSLAEVYNLSNIEHGSSCKRTFAVLHRINIGSKVLSVVAEQSPAKIQIQQTSHPGLFGSFCVALSHNLPIYPYVHHTCLSSVSSYSLLSFSMLSSHFILLTPLEPCTSSPFPSRRYPTISRHLCIDPFLCGTSNSNSSVSSWFWLLLSYQDPRLIFSSSPSLSFHSVPKQFLLFGFNIRADEQHKRHPADTLE